MNFLVICHIYLIIFIYKGATVYILTIAEKCWNFLLDYKLYSIINELDFEDWIICFKHTSHGDDKDNKIFVPHNLLFF